MSSSWSFVSPAIQSLNSPFLPSRPQLSPSLLRLTPTPKRKRSSVGNDKALCCLSSKPQIPQLDKVASILHYGAMLAAIEAPSAFAVTGENSEDDLLTTLVAGGFIAFVYLFVIPPIIMNWLRLRWYKRKFLETYLQFMFVFIFFPGLMLWAPFVNFRKFPRDPTMKYPWSTPKEDTPFYKIR